MVEISAQIALITHQTLPTKQVYADVRARDLTLSKQIGLTLKFMFFSKLDIMEWAMLGDTI